MKKSALTLFILILISISASANHGVVAMGAFFEFLFVIGFTVISTAALVIIYYYKKRKSSAVAVLMSVLCVILIGYLLNHLPDSPYYYLQEWLAMWSVAIVAIISLGVIVTKHFVVLYRNETKSEK